MSLLDGELVVLDDFGRPQFEQLCAGAWMTRAESINAAAQNYAAAIFVFDLLWLKGKDCRQQPITARKIEPGTPLEQGNRIRYASHT